MNYFDYLSLFDKRDTKESFVDYLIEILDYSEETAIKTSEIYYREEEI